MNHLVQTKAIKYYPDLTRSGRTRHLFVRILQLIDSLSGAYYYYYYYSLSISAHSVAAAAHVTCERQTERERAMLAPFANRRKPY